MGFNFRDGPGFRAMYKEVVSLSLWVTWAGTSLTVALAGPFGTFDTQPFSWRLVYWSVLIATAIIIAIMCRVFWRHFLADRPELYEDIAVAASLAVLFAPLLMVINFIAGGPDAYSAIGLFPAMGCVFSVAMATILLRHALREPAKTARTQAQRDRLLDRIEVEPTARLARISSDNHHVRIVTDDGQEHRILMRLGDAVSETHPDAGVLVHRSHWVARDNVAGVKKVEGRDVVQLTCGSTLPVGPKFRDNLSFARVLSD